MHIDTDRIFIPANKPATRYLRIRIIAPSRKPSGDGRTPADVALVLDRSGSMAGTKIDMARRAVTHAIQLLRPEDHFGVVMYDHEVVTMVDRSSATAETKAFALGSVSMIDARGSTNLCAGWLRGAGLARPRPERSAVSRVLLLTDGLANQGVIDPETLVRNARQLRSEGVTTSTFGVGADFDEELLSRIATEGGGHFYFIEHPQQIPDFLTSEMGETLEVVAYEAELILTCDPGIEATVLNGLPVQARDGSLHVRLGSLVADQEITLIIGVVFKGPHAAGGSANVECRLSDRDHTLVAEPLVVSWQALSAEESARQPINPDVSWAVANAIADRARTAALKANRRGDLEASTSIIRAAIEDLKAMVADDARIAGLIDQLGREAAEFAEAMSPMAMKARHFASYSLAYSRAEGGTARRRPPSRT